MERNRQEALERRARMQSQEPAAAQMAGERENDNKEAEQSGVSTGDLQEQANGMGLEAKHDSGLKILTASSKEAPAPPASVVSNLLDELLARRSCAAAGEAAGRYELLDKALQHDGGADDFKVHQQLAPLDGPQAVGDFLHHPTPRAVNQARAMPTRPPL